MVSSLYYEEKEVYNQMEQGFKPYFRWLAPYT